ncbi:MAG: hypothetical protein MUP58_00875 [Candidatus Nanohaloarchaeota archaeon QJJ-9]|nr:hypothetical protein [Candidatus Nanohaloarchaeota archaeon QJJ-9]
MSFENGIDTWMVFEVLAKEEEAASDSLESHVEGLGALESVEIDDKDFDEVKEVENPHPSIEKGFSQVCEVRCSIDSFPSLIEIVMNYGPTMIEVEGPDKLELDLSETQEAANLVAEMMQKFMNAGIGGMMVAGPDKKQQ